MLKEKLWPEIIRNQTVKPNKLTNEKGCSTYTTQRYVDLEMPKHLGKSYRVCIFQPLVQAVFSRTNEQFFPVQQQSQFPKDKFKRQQEVKSDQTWLLPCILPGVCLNCIQTWCGSGYIHIKDTKVGQSQTWTGQISLPLTYRACQRATEEPWLYLLAVISTPHCCCKSVDPQVLILRILMHLTYDDDTLANVLITVLSNQLILVATLATAVFLLKQCVFKPIPFLP